MKRAPYLITAALAAAFSFGTSRTALAGPTSFDPGVDFHMDAHDPNRVIIHQNAEFTTENFARAFKVDPFVIRTLNPEGTIATCYVQGKMKTSPGLTGMELRRSNAIWENCPEDKRFVYIVSGSVIRLRGEMPAPENAPQGEEGGSSSTQSAPSPPVPSASAPRAEPEQAPKVTPANAAELEGLRREMADQSERIRTLESGNAFKNALLAAFALAMLFFGFIWRRASGSLDALRRTRSDNDRARDDLESLKREHVALGHRNAELDHALLTKTNELLRMNEKFEASEQAQKRSGAENARLQRELERLRNEELPRARETVPVAMVSELMSARANFDAAERAFTGHVPDNSVRDLPVGSRAKRIRDLADASAQRLKDLTTRSYMAARMDPPVHEAGIVDFKPLAELPERIQHFYDSVDAQSSLFAQVTAIPELDGESSDQVRTYAELQTENEMLHARVAELEREKRDKAVPEPGSGESQTRPKADADAFLNRTDVDGIVEALIEEPLEERYAPGSSPGIGSAPLTEESGILGPPPAELPEQRPPFESAVHVQGSTLLLDEPPTLVQERSGPRTIRYSDPPSARPLHGVTMQGLHAASLDPLNPEERARFIGTVAWLVEQCADKPFPVRSQVELSTFGLICKLQIVCSGRVHLLWELCDESVYQSLSLPSSDGSETERYEVSRKSLPGFFAGVLAKVTGSQPFDVRTPFEMHCLYRLANLDLLCGNDHIKLYQLSDSRIYGGLHIGKEASGS